MLPFHLNQSAPKAVPHLMKQHQNLPTYLLSPQWVPQLIRPYQTASLGWGRWHKVASEAASKERVWRFSGSEHHWGSNTERRDGRLVQPWYVIPQNHDNMGNMICAIFFWACWWTMFFTLCVNASHQQSSCRSSSSSSSFQSSTWVRSKYHFRVIECVFVCVSTYRKENRQVSGVWCHSPSD